jgi:hypothetical protein
MNWPAKTLETLSDNDEDDDEADAEDEDVADKVCATELATRLRARSQSVCVLSSFFAAGQNEYQEISLLA